MTQEIKKKKPIFQPAGVDEPVKVEPPFQPALEDDEDLSDLMGEAPVPKEEPLPPEPTPPIEEPVETPPPPPEPEQAPEADEDVLSNGWKEITQTQQDGRMYKVAYQYEEDGVQAFWRKTRVLSHNKWTLHGKWTNSLTRATLTPQPLYYKENV